MTQTPAPQAATEAAPETLHGHPVTCSRDQRVVHVSRESYMSLAKSLADDGFHMVVDLTAVDYLHHRVRPLPGGVSEERFEVVVNFLSLEHRERVRVRVQVPESDPSLSSLFALFPGVEAMEREVFDLFGISFTDHPDLTRILMPEDWVGHPLRKDYDVGRIPVQFKSAPEAR